MNVIMAAILKLVTIVHEMLNVLTLTAASIARVLRITSSLTEEDILLNVKV